jgi:hypothetical protein
MSSRSHPDYQFVSRLRCVSLFSSYNRAKSISEDRFRDSECPDVETERQAPRGSPAANGRRALRSVTRSLLYGFDRGDQVDVAAPVPETDPGNDDRALRELSAHPAMLSFHDDGRSRLTTHQDGGSRDADSSRTFHDSINDGLRRPDRRRPWVATFTRRVYREQNDDGSINDSMHPRWRRLAPPAPKRTPRGRRTRPPILLA